ncbi:RING finger domain-containing protein, partial [Methylicorpusculum sp.]|uniref:RING finger domain-containing protein n=1 Tax=Methylicorpusculum sp. TaxID=2713644 RepID=UPI002ABCAE72
HANASRYLGKLYYLGEGTATNYPKARQLLEQETTQEIEPKIQAFAWHLLGGIYYWGQGAAINHIKARNYFTLAANQIAATDIQAFSRRYLREMNRLGEGVILADTESPTNTNAEKAPECVICLEEANEQRGALGGLPCYNYHGQVIHQACLDTLMSQQTPHCPLCRVKLINPKIKK